MLKVRIQNKAGKLPLTRAEVVALVRAAAPCGWLHDGAVDVLVTDDRGIGVLNRRFLDREGPTDVIAFSLADEGSPPENVQKGDDNTLGEVVISAETARRVAKERGHGFREELALYVVHGLTHLAGYDDATAAQKRRMYAREREVLTAAGYAYVR
jgi:probable rRNA maturation factor